MAGGAPRKWKSVKAMQEAIDVYFKKCEGEPFIGDDGCAVRDMYKLPQVTINNEKVLLRDGQIMDIDGIKIECCLVPGHTWGHMVYLIDDKYLFTGDTIWFGADGGYEGRFTQCGICTLLKKLGLYDLTPAMCHLDYTMSEAGGVTNFVRQYTLASGGPYCDCGYKKKTV